MTAAEGSAHAPVLDRVKGQPGVLGLLRGALAHPCTPISSSGRPAVAGLMRLSPSPPLLCSRGGCGECASCQETPALRHPDLEVVERVGASISVKQARKVARMALRTPRAAPYQVLVLVDFLFVDEAARALLNRSRSRRTRP